MRQVKFESALFAAAIALAACSGKVDAQSGAAGPMTTGAENVELPETNHYAIDTPHGRMVVRLSDETPEHRDNFKRLVANGFYDGTTFHRIISGFMIQGGDPLSKDEDPDNDGQGGPGYTIPAEITPTLYHKRGALATARTSDQVNPERASSGSQFYIVHGTVYDDATLDTVQRQIAAATRDPGFAFTDEMREVYRTQGGAPNLDQQYTVFGEVIEGLDVLDAIANAPTPRSSGTPAPPQRADRPVTDIPMTITPLPDHE